MDIISDYYAVTAYGQNELNSIVRSMISQGWQPFGSTSTVLKKALDDHDVEIDVIIYTQALVKYQEFE